MSIASMGELEKRQRLPLREEAVQRRPVSEGGEKGRTEAAEEQQTPVKGKRKTVGREEVEAKRRRMAVKCSQEQGMEERQTGVAVKCSEERGMEAPTNKRKMVGREEVEAKKMRIDKEAGVVVKCTKEEGVGTVPVQTSRRPWLMRARDWWARARASLFPMKQMSEDNQQLIWLKNKAVRQERKLKVLEETAEVMRKKLLESAEENRIVRLRTKIQHEENKEEVSRFIESSIEKW